MTGSAKPGNDIDVVLAVSFHSKQKVLRSHIGLSQLLLLDKGNADRRSDRVIIEVNKRIKPMN